MANKEITDLPDAAALDGTEYMIVTQGGNSRKVLLSDLATWVQTETSIVPTNLPWRGCIASRTSDLTGITWPINIPWQQALVDTDGMWSIANATRITVPTGVSKVRVQGGANLEAAQATGSFFPRINRNGVEEIYIGVQTVRNSSSGGFNANSTLIMSGVLDVTPGDYFEFNLNVSMTGVDQILAATRTYLQVEIVEYSGA